ncbi:hypothetical protein HDV01_002242 [Terramyces sp. JEL0728]|nr:hypothetical protein HDV01_002242 [Terramyces sp. JEL0728]
MKISVLLIGFIYARRHHGGGRGGFGQSSNNADQQIPSTDSQNQPIPPPNFPGIPPDANGPPPGPPPPGPPPPGIFVMSDDEPDVFNSGRKGHHRHHDGLGRNEVDSTVLPAATAAPTIQVQLPSNNSNDNSTSSNDDDGTKKDKNNAKQAAQTPVVFASLLAMLIVLPAFFVGFKYYYNRKYKNEHAPSRESTEFDLEMPPPAPALMRLSLEALGNQKRVDSLGFNPIGFATNGSDLESLVNSDEKVPRIGSGFSLGSSVIRNSNVSSARVSKEVTPDISRAKIPSESLNINRLSVGSSLGDNGLTLGQSKSPLGNSQQRYSASPARLSDISGPILKTPNPVSRAYSPSPLRLSELSGPGLDRMYSPSPLRLSVISGPQLSPTLESSPQISPTIKMPTISEMQPLYPHLDMNLQPSPTPLRISDISGPHISTSNAELVSESPTFNNSGVALGLSPAGAQEALGNSPVGRMATFSFVSVDREDPIKKTLGDQPLYEKLQQMYEPKE